MGTCATTPADSGVDAAKDCGGHGTNVSSIAAGYNSAGGLTAEDFVGFNYGLGVAPFALVGASKIFTCAGAFAGGWTPERWRRMRSATARDLEQLVGNEGDHLTGRLPHARAAVRRGGT